MGESGSSCRSLRRSRRLSSGNGSRARGLPTLDGGRLPGRWRLYLLAFAWPIATTLLSVAIADAAGVGPADLTFPWGVNGPGFLTTNRLDCPIDSDRADHFRRGIRLARLSPGPTSSPTDPVESRCCHRPDLGCMALPADPLRERAVRQSLGRVADFPDRDHEPVDLSSAGCAERTGDVWSTSIGHGSNNVTEDSWHRTAFTGLPGTAPLSPGADIALVVAEAIVLIGIVLAARLFRRSTPRQTTPTTKRHSSTLSPD